MHCATGSNLNHNSGVLNTTIMAEIAIKAKILRVYKTFQIAFYLLNTQQNTAFMLFYSLTAKS